MSPSLTLIAGNDREMLSGIRKPVQAFDDLVAVIPNDFSVVDED